MRGPSLISVGVGPPLWREARIGLEAAALVRDPVFRGDGMADGRGRPVLLIPGFLAGDGSLSMMAGWLKRTGYRPSRAGIVSNVELRRRARCRGSRSGSSGWWTFRASAPLWWARAAAGRSRRCSQGGGPTWSPAWSRSAHRRWTRSPCTRWCGSRSRPWAAWARSERPGLFKRSCIRGDCCASFWEDLAGPLAAGIPLVAVYSKSDGVVDWHSCLDPHATRTGRDPHLPLRHGRVAIRVARRGRGARELRGRRRSAPSPAAARVHRLPRAA